LVDPNRHEKRAGQGEGDDEGIGRDGDRGERGQGRGQKVRPLDAGQDRPGSEREDEQQIRRERAGQDAGVFPKEERSRFQRGAPLELADAQPAITDQPIGGRDPADQRSEEVEDIENFSGRFPRAEPAKGEAAVFPRRIRVRA
jgi:hypothetical protein